MLAVLSASCILIHLFLKITLERGVFVFSILEIKKVNHREAKTLSKVRSSWVEI